MYIYIYLGGGNSKIFLFATPKIGEDEPILRVAYFSKGLVKNHQLENVLGCVFFLTQGVESMYNVLYYI